MKTLDKLIYFYFWIIFEHKANEAELTQTRLRKLHEWNGQNI